MSNQKVEGATPLNPPHPSPPPPHTSPLWPSGDFLSTLGGHGERSRETRAERGASSGARDQRQEHPASACEGGAASGEVQRRALGFGVPSLMSGKTVGFGDKALRTEKKPQKCGFPEKIL